MQGLFDGDAIQQLPILLTRQALRQQIAALPAATMPGLQAKARVVLLWLAPDGEAPVDPDDADGR